MRIAQLTSVSPGLLSLALVFSVAAQLRLPGLPVGVGEALLLLWLLSTLASTWNWRDPSLAGVLFLTAVGALLLGAGYFLMSYPAGLPRPPALHDTLAYAFCAVLAINYARLSDRHEGSLPAALLWAFLFSALLALVLGIIAKDWSGIDALYDHTRWQHLSNNPNQFALLVLPLPFLALYLTLRQGAKDRVLMPTIACLVALALGFYSMSDALMLAWIGGGLVTLLALPNSGPDTQHRGPQARLVAALLIVLMVSGSAWQVRDIAAGIVLGSGSGVRPGGDACSEAGLPKSRSESDERPSQASVRLCLWRNGLKAIQYAPLTGMGPGPHSGFITPFSGQEAHNTLIDWGTQTGVAGMVALVTVLAWLLWQVARRRQYELTAMLLALYCFAMFHHVLRQPIFWVIPLLAWSLAASSKRYGRSASAPKPGAKG